MRASQKNPHAICILLLLLLLVLLLLLSLSLEFFGGRPSFRNPIPLPQGLQSGVEAGKDSCKEVFDSRARKPVFQDTRSRTSTMMWAVV